jgi:hypothetical protein
MTTNQLRIESAAGLPLMEYRIHHGHIEARSPVEGEDWRRLSAREFSDHLAQNPALAQWLRARAQQRPGSDEASAA